MILIILIIKNKLINNIRLMNKILIEEIKKISKIIMKLVQCSSQNCGKLFNKLKKDKETYNKYLKANTEIDIIKKEKLLNEIYKNKLVYEYNNCIIINCKNIYIESLDILEKIINISSHSNEIKINIINILNKIKKIFKFKNLSKKKINEVIINFSLLQSLLKSI